MGYWIGCVIEHKTVDLSGLGAILQGFTAPIAIAWAFAAFRLQSETQKDQQDFQREQQRLQEQQIDLAVMPDLHLHATLKAASIMYPSALAHSDAITPLPYILTIENTGEDAAVANLRIEGLVPPPDLSRLSRYGTPWRQQFPKWLKKGAPEEVEIEHTPRAHALRPPSGPIVIHFVDKLGRHHEWSYPISQGPGAPGAPYNYNIAIGEPIKARRQPPPPPVTAAPPPPGSPVP